MTPQGQVTSCWNAEGRTGPVMFNGVPKARNKAVGCWDGKQQSGMGATRSVTCRCVQTLRSTSYTLSREISDTKMYCKRKGAMGGASLSPELNPSYRPENRLMCPGVLKRQFPICRAGRDILPSNLPHCEPRPPALPAPPPCSALQLYFCSQLKLGADFFRASFAPHGSDWHPD